jgi:hypothetical protein
LKHVTTVLERERERGAKDNVCQCGCVFPTEDNDAKVPQVFAQNYETHQTRETFHENFLQSPLRLNVILWSVYIRRKQNLRPFAQENGGLYVCIPLNYAALFAVRDKKNNTARSSTAVRFAEGRTEEQIVKNSIEKLQKLN